MYGFDINGVNQAMGTNIVGKIQKVSQTTTTPINFKNTGINLPKTTLATDTMDALAILDGESFPQYMADDLLATPYVGLNYNG